MKIKQNFIYLICEGKSIVIRVSLRGEAESSEKHLLNVLLHITSNHYDEQTKTRLSFCLVRSYAHYDPLKRVNKLCITHTLLDALSRIYPPQHGYYAPI